MAIYSWPLACNVAAIVGPRGIKDVVVADVADFDVVVVVVVVDVVVVIV